MLDIADEQVLLLRRVPDAVRRAAAAPPGALLPPRARVPQTVLPDEGLRHRTVTGTQRALLITETHAQRVASAGDRPLRMAGQ